MGLHVAEESFVGNENPSMSARRARGWMTLNEAAFYCGCGRNTMAELVANGDVVSVPDVSSRLRNNPTNNPNRRVISVDSLDLYMLTDW